MEIDEYGKKLKLWVRRKKRGWKLICSRCGQPVAAGLIHEVREREVRDRPCFEYTTTVVVETYRVKCRVVGYGPRRWPSCRARRPIASAARKLWDKLARVRPRAKWRDGWVWRRAQCVPSICAIGSDGMPSDARHRYDRWEWMNSIGARRASFSRWCVIWQPGSRYGLAASGRRRRWMISLAASWSAGSGNGSKPPAWTCGSRSGRASWQWAPQCKIVYDKFHSMQHANAVIEEVRKAEFFR